MAQTVAVVRNTLTATLSGTTDFTKTGFGTPTAAIIIVCNATNTVNPQVHGYLSIGFWDGTNQRAVGVGGTDNSATMAWSRASDNSYGAFVINGDDTNSAAYSVSSITDGIRLTMAVDNTGATRLCTVILLAGVSAAVGNLTMNATQNATQASGSLGFAPKQVFFTTIGAGSVDQAATAGGMIAFGFARDDATHRLLAFSAVDNVADEQANILYSETRCVGQISADATTWTGEVTTFGADTFTMTTRDGGSGSDIIMYLALGGADLSIDVGTYTTRTSTGNNVIATDVAPDAVLVALSTATGTTIETGSGANGLMVGMADDNGQFAHNFSVEDAAAISNANSAAQAAALIDLDSSSGGTRTDMVSGTVTLNSADFTVNETAVDATARKGWWVAFGPAGGSGVSGSAAQTLDNVTQSASGKVGHVGAAAQTLGNVTQSAAGKVGHVGAAGQTLDNVTQAAAGKIGHVGDAAQTLDVLSQTASGKIGHKGDAGQTLGPFTQSAEGVVGDGEPDPTFGGQLERRRRRIYGRR